MVSWCLLLMLGTFFRVAAETPAKGHEDQEDLLRQLMSRLEKLENNTDRSQVAFSASLVTTSEGTSVGPFETDTPLVFRKVTTNVGNAYNPDTGVFTAPTKGLYYICLTGSAGDSKSLNAAVMKNEENMFAIYNHAEGKSADSNGMTLVLEAGDRVHVVLWANQIIFDQSRLSTFSGFLVFPM